MALTATIHHFEIALSDVDRSVYETLDLRIAQHPSETMPRVLARTLGYCLSYEEGIAFSKGGLSSTDEAPITIRDATGLLRAWIEVGAPSAERLHKASKAANKVIVYTHELAQLRRQTAGQTIHKANTIEVWEIDAKFLDVLVGKIDRRAKLELTCLRGTPEEAALYVTIGGETLESTLSLVSLVSET